MNILDTTVRDGSYAVDFKFSCKDVADLVSKSERLGIQYIEIGHGQGLNASSLEHGISLHTDVEYMRAARQATGNAKLGFFCIPGIARLEDIDTAREYGMNFIRIGVNPNNLSDIEPYLARANQNGIAAFVNIMKSYTIKPAEFAVIAKSAYEAGAYGIYLVDSAGCMCTDEIGQYIDAIRQMTPIQIGFHGHNNLGLAVENTIYCVKKGIDFIDCTFQGLGRSVGNASLEQVVMILSKLGYDKSFDIPRVLEYGYAGLRNTVRRPLINPLDYMCGYAGFHSGYIKYIYKCSNEKKVDPLRLIIAYSELDQTNMDYERLLQVADTLPKDLDDNPYNFGEYFKDRYNE